MLSTLPRLLHLWHMASLDAPTVAVTWTIAFAMVSGVQLKPWILVLIACGTWTVYVGDRLLDARRAMRSDMQVTLRARHYFHWRNRRWLIPAAATAAAATAVLVIRMPGAVRQHDSVLAAAALMYFSGVHAAISIPHWMRRLLSKEFLVGVLFTAGCAAPTLSHLHSIPWSLIACLTLFASLAWLNCSAISEWELPGRRTEVFRRATLLGAISFAWAFALFFTNVHASAFACAAGTSALLLGLLDQSRAKFSPLTLRAFADIVLLTPMVLIATGALK